MLLFFLTPLQTAGLIKINYGSKTFSTSEAYTDVIKDLDTSVGDVVYTSRISPPEQPERSPKITPIGNLGKDEISPSNPKGVSHKEYDPELQQYQVILNQLIDMDGQTVTVRLQGNNFSKGKTEQVTGTCEVKNGFVYIQMDGSQKFVIYTHLSSSAWIPVEIIES